MTNSIVPKVKSKGTITLKIRKNESDRKNEPENSLIVSKNSENFSKQFDILQNNFNNSLNSKRGKTLK